MLARGPNGRFSESGSAPRWAMQAQTREQGRHLGGRPPYPVPAGRRRTPPEPGTRRVGPAPAPAGTGPGLRTRSWAGRKPSGPRPAPASTPTSGRPGTPHWWVSFLIAAAGIGPHRPGTAPSRSRPSSTCTATSGSPRGAASTSRALGTARSDQFGVNAVALVRVAADQGESDLVVERGPPDLTVDQCRRYAHRTSRGDASAGRGLELAGGRRCVASGVGTATARSSGVCEDNFRSCGGRGSQRRPCPVAGAVG